MRKTLLLFLAVFVILVLFLVGRVRDEAEQPAQTGTITLATTTSTEDSGLLDFILPAFTEETGWGCVVKVVFFNSEKLPLIIEYQS